MTISSRLVAPALVLFGTATLANHASAQMMSTVTEWNYNNNTVAVNTSPAPSTGSGTASTLGMNAAYNGAQTADISDINTATPLSTDPGTTNQQWRIRAGDPSTGLNSTTTNGWSSNAPIGSQGAQFLVSTAGFSNIQVSFDWSPTNQGEGKLQLQYTLDGTTYLNLPISLFTSFGTGATAVGMTNTTSMNTVMGGYLAAGSSTVYMNGISANLGTIAGAANDAKFGIRLVSAATGTDDTNVAGAALNNTSGNWRFDEVTISGTAVPAPEPSAFVLVGICLTGAAVAFHRRRRSARLDAI